MTLLLPKKAARPPEEKTSTAISGELI